MTDVPTREVLINGKWPLVLPEHRAAREEWATGWEPERLDSMYANLRPGMVLYDIGTEEGDLSALFAKWVRGCTDQTCPCQDGDVCHYVDLFDSRAMDTPAGWHRGGVVMVEPNPPVWPNIRLIWEANQLPDPLWCFEGFVADVNRGMDIGQYEGRAQAVWPEPSHRWPASAFGAVIGDHGFRNVMEHPEQACVTIDTIASHFAPPPDAITMDIEGAEILAARGMTETLATHRPLVWVSVHAEAMFHDWGVYQAEFHSEFHRNGYEKQFLGFDHEQHWFYYPSERRNDVVLP